MPIITGPASTVVSIVVGPEASSVASIAAALMALTRRLVMSTKRSRSSTVLRALLTMHLMIQMARVPAIALLTLGRRESTLTLQVVYCRARTDAGWSWAGTTAGDLGRITKAAERILVAPMLTGRLLMPKTVILPLEATSGTAKCI